MYLLILYLSFVSFLISILYGKYIGAVGSIYVTVFCMFVCNICSIFLFYEVGCLHAVCYIDLANWVNLDLLNIKYNFLFDSLTVVMLLVITSISLFAHVYSIDYMHSEAHLVRFLSYLSLFTFCMIVLVTANNLLQLFVGWEGVGLCSYLLINFWFLRVQANKSALKALLVNKISDLCLVFGVSLIVALYYSLDYSVIFTPIMRCYCDSLVLFGNSVTMLNLICLLLFVGAMGKSAQIGLHVWLPDAMEGPTPVSSLIHAATMVTAGVFLVVRMSFFFEFATSASLFIIMVGAFTVFFSSTIGVLQNDVKKVIAYSTCSQIGYMLFACGYSGYAVAMFHLFNHAFFKALLFLTAGSIIHASSNEQDIRRMGGFIKVVPFSYISFFVGSVSLMGFPFLTGYYSKDAIIEFAYSFMREFYMVQPHSIFVVRSFYLLSVISILLTSVYSIRTLYFLFLCEYNGLRVTISKLADSPLKMNVILFCLVLCSIFIGFVFFDTMAGFGTDFWQNSMFFYNAFDYEFISVYARIIPIVYSLYGALLCLLLYQFVQMYTFLYSLQSYPLFHSVFYFFNRRWMFDKLYNEYLVRHTFTRIAYGIFFRLFDKGILDYVGPSGISLCVKSHMWVVSRLQTGFVYHYAGIMLNIFLILFILFFMDLTIINDFIWSLMYINVLV